MLGRNGLDINDPTMDTGADFGAEYQAAHEKQKA